MYNRVVAALFATVICTGCQPHGKPNIVKERYDASVVKVHLPLADEQYQRGEYAAAAGSALKAIEADPHSTQAHLIYGKSLLAMGKYSLADDHFSIAIDLDPSLDEAWYGRGAAADGAGNRPAACQSLEKAVELNPSNVDAIIYLADLYIGSNQFDKALALFAGKVQTDTKMMKAAAAIYFRLGKTDEAVGLYEHLCQANPQDTSLAETLGYAYIEAGRQRDAAELFEMLCEQVPDSAITYFPIAASCYLRAGQYQKVIAICDRYAAIGKGNAAFWITMGQASVGMKDAARAVYSAKRAAAMAPADEEAIILLGCAMYLDGTYEEAVRVLDRVTDTGNPFVWVMKSRCYDKLGRMDQAATALASALALDPDSETAKKLAREYALRSDKQTYGAKQQPGETRIMDERIQESQH